MSISCNIYLPNDVSAKSLITAVAYLLGATRKKMELNPKGDSFAAWCLREEVGFEANKETKYIYPISTHDLQYYCIQIAPTNIDKQWHTGSLFIYPSFEYPNHILLSGGASEFWKTVGVELVKMFGGYTDYNDCDTTDFDLKLDKPRKTNCPNDGNEWDEFQSAFFALPQIAKFINKTK